MENPNKNLIHDNEVQTSRINYNTALFAQFVALGGTCLRDGDMYGAVIGDLPTGCAAFEKTRAGAITACMHNFHTEEAKIPGAQK